jgi:DNA polymerase (family 10)
VAGSYRRGKETVHDLDFLAATRKPDAVTAAFAAAPFAASVVACGPTKASIRLANGVPCDLRAVDNAAYPFALQYFTGSKEHNIALRGRAQKLGFTLNEYRLAPAGDKDVDAPGHITGEDGIYRALGLDFIPPELRENSGEIEAAEAGELPKLVELDNLRGTFHNHTTASDGHATLAEMAAAAQELGLGYLGIADHSKSSFQANGLDANRLLDQVREIGRLNTGFDGFRLFAGVECDILKDGSLDYPDEVLAQLDYVVASVHGSFNLPEAEMTARVIRAIENTYVTMLGHLTGRLLLKRDPYQIDIPAVIEAAAATGTVIELNANPWRLDMDWRWWKLAKEKGVKCAINPDAHSARGLQDLYFGVRAARKGWLERGDVINCLPLGKVEAALARKRGGGGGGAAPAGRPAVGKGGGKPKGARSR